MRKLVVAYIIENDEDVIELSIKSIERIADAVVIIDGNKEPGRYQKYANKFEKSTYVHYPYQHKSLGANGHQRNKYLEVLKKEYMDWYCLVLDADEVLDDKSYIDWNALEEVDRNNGVTIFNPRMIHYINHFGQEDASSEIHWCLGRFFKVTPDVFYPEVEHPLIQNDNTESHENGKTMMCNDMVLHHLGYCKEMFNIRKKYLNHKKKSNIHTKEFLQDWYYSHLTGKYPVRQFNYDNVPMIIKDYFSMEDTEEPHYFFNRQQLEPKHMLEVLTWNEYFKPKTVLEIGCGFAQRSWCFERIGAKAEAFDISKYAINKTPFKVSSMHVCNVAQFVPDKTYDFVFIYDLLEHIRYEEIDLILDTISKTGNAFLFSIPFIGDPNLENDRTHIIKETKEWWVKKINSHGMHVEDTPSHFQHQHQILVARK